MARWVKACFGVHYADRGMTALLRRLGYRYKKPRLPGKAPAPEVQEAFVASYRKLKENKRDPPVAQSGAWRRLDQARALLSPQE